MQAQNKKKQSRNESHRNTKLQQQYPSEWLPSDAPDRCLLEFGEGPFVRRAARPLAAAPEEHVPREGLHFYVIFREKLYSD
jgi:hypothetical protein